jgi:hypothetical protein
LDTSIKNHFNSPSVWAILFTAKIKLMQLVKHGLGYILGDFRTKASGHPASERTGNLKYFLTFGSPRCTATAIAGDQFFDKKVTTLHTEAHS